MYSIFVLAYADKGGITITELPGFATSKGAMTVAEALFNKEALTKDGVKFHWFVATKG